MHYKMNKEHRATFWNSVAKIDTVYIIYTPAKIDFDYWVFITEIVYTFTRKVQLIGVRRVWSDYFKSEKKIEHRYTWMNEKIKKSNTNHHGQSVSLIYPSICRNSLPTMVICTAGRDVDCLVWLNRGKRPWVCMHSDGRVYTYLNNTGLYD